jgi:carbon-monoxide dehydrogenase small subunit
MTLADYLEHHHDPSEMEIRVALSGNLCRCTGYAEIVDAALEVAREMRTKSAVS